MKAKATWENCRFRASDESLQAYFIEQLRLARLCLPSASASDINYIIIQQLPQRAREVLATIEYAETSKITQALARMDLTRKAQENSVAHANMQNGFNRPNNNNEFHSAKSYSEPVRQMGR